MLKPILGAMVLLFTGILLLPILSYTQTATIPSSSSSSTAESFWNNGAPMPTPRTEIAAALLGDNIYVIGGFDKSGRITDIVEFYNLYGSTALKCFILPIVTLLTSPFILSLSNTS
jgi:Kelch motif